MTATLKKFMFETAFDDVPEPEPVAPDPVESEAEEQEPEVIVPTFSEGEVDAARAEGFTAGKQEGQQETSVSVEARIAETLAVIETKFKDMFKIQEDGNAELSRAAIAVAMGVAHKVVPSLADSVALDEVERVVQSVFEKIVEEPRVTLTVHPELADAIGKRIETMGKGRPYEGNIHVQPDDSVPVGDCRMEWSNGGTERDSNALWRDIDEVADRYLESRPTAWDRPDESIIEPATQQTQTETPKTEPAEDVVAENTPEITSEIDD